MRVLVTSTSGSGHFQPLVPLIRAFHHRGDDVMVVVPPNLATTIDDLDVAYRVGGEPTAADRTRVWSQFSTLERRDASRLVEREWFAHLCLDAMLPVVTEVVDSWSPQLILRETCEYAAALSADTAGIACAQVGISTADAESRVLRRLVAPSLNERRAGLAERLFEAPYLTKFPPSLDPSPFSRTVRYREFAHAVPRPLPDWWPGDDAPLIYVTLGTMAMRIAAGKELLLAMLDVVAMLDVRILVTTGPTMPPAELGVVAENVHVESWVDQSDVLPHAALVLCHGGSGTVYGALGAGVPLVIAPIFADQPTNAKLVESAGAGVALCAGGHSSDENLRALHDNLTRLPHVVNDVLRDERYRLAAQRLAVELRTADDPSALAARLAAHDPALFGR